MTSINQPIIKKIPYGKDCLKKINEKNNQAVETYILNFPTVYIVSQNTTKAGTTATKYEVYVGETNDINQRTDQHLNTDVKPNNSWDKFLKNSNSNLYIIGHDHFNKSLTMDVENRLMLYLSSVPNVIKVDNRRENEQNHYFPEKEASLIFSKIWAKLQQDNSTLFPVESVIRDSAIFKASPFHKLTDEQFQAQGKIINCIHKAMQNETENQLILIEGAAGTGKTVLLSTIFYAVSQIKKNNSHNQTESVSTSLLVNQNEQLKVYNDIAQKLGIEKKKGEAVMKPATFIHNFEKKGEAKQQALVDVALVDEAHLLWTQGTQGYSGENELADIRKHSKITVAIFDPQQVLSNKGYIESEDFENAREESKRQNNYITLKKQMRIQASKETVDWITNFVYKGEVRPFKKDEIYSLKIFDDAEAMHQAIKNQNTDFENSGLSRLVATFDWAYTDGKKNNNRADGRWVVNAGNLTLPWNSTKGQLPWAERPETIDEIGSTFTIQGFDLNYCGVILGPSVTYRKGKVQIISKNSQDSHATDRRMLKSGEYKDVSNELLLNQLNVLMTRGVHGLYIYAVDDELRKELHARCD